MANYIIGVCMHRGPLSSEHCYRTMSCMYESKLSPLTMQNILYNRVKTLTQCAVVYSTCIATGMEYLFLYSHLPIHHRDVWAIMNN